MKLKNKLEAANIEAEKAKAEAEKAKADAEAAEAKAKADAEAAVLAARQKEIEDSLLNQEKLLAEIRDSLKK